MSRGDTLKSLANVYLRPLEVRDAGLVNKWHNDPQLYHNLGGVFRHVSTSATEEWIRERTRYTTSEISLAICESADGSHIGNIYLRSIDWIARNAEMHVFIGDATKQRRGLGSAAITHLLRHAFNDLRLHRIYLHVIAGNEVARSAYEGCGFKAEGVLRQHAVKPCGYVDVVVMAILASEWEKGQDGCASNNG